MSNDGLELLSDIELHQKLLQCGFPNVPITETTRAILINKLRKFLKNKSKQSSNRSSLTKNHDSYKTISNTNENLTNNPNMIYKYATRPCNQQKNKILSDVPAIMTDSSFDSLTKSEKEATYQIDKQPGNFKVVHKLLKLRERTVCPAPFKNQHFGNVEPVAAFSRRQPVSQSNFPISGISFLETILQNIKYQFRQLESKQSIIPCMLIISLIFFLFIISFVYLSQQPSQQEHITYELCSDSLETTEHNCVDNDFLHKGIALSKHIFNILSKKLSSYKCSDFDILPSISLRKLEINVDITQSDLKAALYIINKNPQFNILIEHQEQDCDATSDHCETFFKDINFKLQDNRLIMKCSLYRKIYRFFVVVGFLFILVLICSIILGIMKFFKNLKKKRKSIVNNIIHEINNILLVLSSKQPGEQSNEVILNNIKDQILKSLAKPHSLSAWDEAISYLEKNDNRLSFGSVLVNGETFKTIKWNSKATISGSEFYAKKWNSPAFDNTNRAIDPPTPCLKIRHMFDASEAGYHNLKDVLFNAIYEKVGNKCTIVDFQVDLQTCCVYIRCETEKDAGIIHKEINGWWFDKRLVSIKFLHLDRYLCRFPNSKIPIQNI